WVSAASSLSTCICPIFLATQASTCFLCLAKYAPSTPATILFKSLQTNCASDTTAVANIILKTLNINATAVATSSDTIATTTSVVKANYVAGTAS
ncbi:hypothetical protein HK096_004725, partial [Nowakowskiella sp. JEL0078]